MTKLAVGGCSYSDYTGVDNVYGEYCAERLGLEYKHYARGGSGSQRMYYALTKAIENKELGPGDVIVLQYTDPHRKLLPEPLPPVILPGSTDGQPGQIETWETPYGKAYTSDYKSHSWQWQPNETTKSVHRALENCFNNEFETDYIMTLNTMFIALAERNAINIIPFQCRFIDFNHWEGKELTRDDMAGPLRDRLPPHLQNRIFRELDFVRVGNKREPVDSDMGFDWPDNPDYDGSHLSDMGHRLIGHELAEHIRRHKVLNPA